MRGHLPVASLSAYLDGEAEPAESRRIAAHIAACAACREHLEGLRRTVGALASLRPADAVLPAGLATLIRRRIDERIDEAGAAAGTADAATALPRLPRLRRWRRSWWQGAGEPAPRRALLSAPLAAGLVLIVSLLAIEHGTAPGLGAFDPALPRTVRLNPQFRVSEVLGDAPVVMPQTTSEVAGRVFVYSDDVWVQRGLDASDVSEPRARVPAGSPRGRALLARYGDLAVLIADGSRVVLRDRRATLELWNGS
jgi:hypothetical protein